MKLFDTYKKIAEVGIKNLKDIFWDEKNNHWHRSHDGLVADWSQDVWENGQSLFALTSYAEATGDKWAIDMVQGQWDYLKSGEIPYDMLVGNKDEKGVPYLGEEPYWAQDDAAWGAMEFMAIYRVTKDKEALDWVHTMVVNSYNYWGTGEQQNFKGTMIRPLTDGLYYTYHEDYKAPSIYSAPVMAAALEYCMFVNHEHPEEVDIYQPTLNLYHWNQEYMCRNGKKVFKNFDENGDLVVDYVDDLYYVDYHRDGKNGPTGARDPSRITVGGSYSGLFGNMGMAAISAIFYQITGEQSFKENALKTINGINKFEVHQDCNTFMNDRDANVNTSTLGYYVRYAMTLPEVTLEMGEPILNTAKLIDEKNHVPGTSYYYMVWNNDEPSKKNFISGYPHGLPCYVSQPVFATTVHALTGAVLYCKIKNL